MHRCATPGLLLLLLATACRPARSALPATPRAVTSPVTYFEIPVTDLDRAIRFYEAVFTLTLSRTTIDGHPMALFPAADGDTGATGALATGDSYVPSLDGTRVYFRVDAVDATLARAIAAGGRELYPATTVGPETRVAEFADSEGNRIALIGAPVK